MKMPRQGQRMWSKAKLKVMLEQDYLSMSKHIDGGVAEGGSSPARADFGEHAGETRGQDPTSIG